MRRCLVLVLLAGCPSLPTPAELGEPQILALVADPPCTSAGSPAVLTALVAGPDGTIVPDAIEWSLPAGAPAVLAAGSDGSEMVVADDGATLGSEIEIDVAITAGGAHLRGFRTLPIAGSCNQPDAVHAIVDGMPAATPLSLTAGATVTLDITGGVAPNAIISWYSTAGTIDLYRHSPTDLVVREATGAAVLYVVYREGPAVTWSGYSVDVER